MAKLNVNVNTSEFKEVGKVHSTKEYSLFKTLKGNRKLNNRTYAKIVVSMKEEQLMIPILVNENLEIIDGQHRFAAEQELGLPVYFVIVPGYGLDEVKRANIASSNWTKEDFLDAFVEDEIEDYIVLREIVDYYGISLNNVLKVFAKVQSISYELVLKSFEEGTFKAVAVEDVEKFLTALDDFKFFKFSKGLQFFSAFLSLYFHPLYNHEGMLKRMKNKESKLVKMGSKDDYLLVLTRDIYSFGAVRKPIYYDKETKKFYTN